MSIETVLLILFLLLPLLNLLRLATQKSQPRQQPERPPARPQPVRLQPPGTTRFPLPQPANIARSGVPVTPAVQAAVEVPEVAAAKRYLPQERVAQRKPGERRSAPTAGPAPPTDPEQNARDQRDVLRSLRSPGGVRRALVAITVLGPCRAMEPYDWREAGSSHR